MSCAKSELCIFDTAFPQVVVENSAFEEVFPINTITGKNDTDIEFNIIASNTDYLDLNDTLFSIQLKVLNGEKELVAADDVVPANYIFHTLFKDVILSLNNVKVEGGNNYYSHKALIETIINYNNDTKDTSLASIGYDDDEADRKAWIATSKTFSMCGSLQLDFFDQPKYLIPGVSVHLRLKRNIASFSLKAAGGLKPVISVTDARLLIRRVRVDSSVMMGHNIGLNTKNALYPLRKTEFVSYTLPKGTSNFYKDQIFGDQRLPKFVLVTFQSNAQYNGSYTEDCSIFKNLDVTSMTLSRNTDYREHYSQNFGTDNYMTSYVISLIRNMGHLDKNLNCGIAPSEFKDKYPFFTFVLAPDFDLTTTQLPKQGNLRLDIKFGSALAEPASVIIYATFDSEIQINKSRLVIVE